AVPPPLTGNYMPSLADLSFTGLYDSVYSVEMPRVESVRPSRVIIKDWVSNDEDVFTPENLQTVGKPSFKRIEFTNARNESVKPDKQAEKPRIVIQNPKVDKRE
ncbi:hypothetical protein Tco_1149911, partial [Tanacetum coccineum]